MKVPHYKGNPDLDKAVSNLLQRRAEKRAEGGKGSEKTVVTKQMLNEATARERGLPKED